MKKILSSILPILAVLIALFLIFPNDKNKYDLSVVDNEFATIVVSDSNNNSVKIGKESLIESEEYSVTINVVDGYELTQIKLNNEIIDLQSTFTFVATSNVVIEVACSQIVVGDFNLNIICMHADISVVDSNNNSIDNGTNVLFENEEYTVTIDIHNAYDVSQIRVNGEVIPLANPFTFVAVADTIIIIDTTPIVYMPPSEDGGITITPTPEETTYNISSIELPTGVDAVMYYGDNLSKYTNDLDFILNYDFAENEEFKIDLVNNNNMAMKYQLNDGETLPYLEELTYSLNATTSVNLVVEECQPSLFAIDCPEGVSFSYVKGSSALVNNGLPEGQGNYYVNLLTDNPYFKLYLDGVEVREYTYIGNNTNSLAFGLTLGDTHRILTFEAIDVESLESYTLSLSSNALSIINNSGLTIQVYLNSVLLGSLNSDSNLTLYKGVGYDLYIPCPDSGIMYHCTLLGYESSDLNSIIDNYDIGYLSYGNGPMYFKLTNAECDVYKFDLEYFDPYM